MKRLLLLLCLCASLWAQTPSYTYVYGSVTEPGGIPSTGTLTITPVGFPNGVAGATAVRVINGQFNVDLVASAPYGATYSVSYTNTGGTFSYTQTWSVKATSSGESSDDAKTTAGVATTITATNASASFSNSSQQVTLTATVTSTSTVNSGSVTFQLVSGNALVGNSVSAAVTNGSASAQYTLPAGQAIGAYTIQATYVPGSGLSASVDNNHAVSVLNAGGGSGSLAGGAAGSIPYQSGSGTTAMLAGNTSAVDQVLVSHGTGTAAQAPTLSNAPALSAANMTFPVLPYVPNNSSGTNTMQGTLAVPAISLNGNDLSTTLSGKQNGLTLTTQGGSGAATLIGNTLNIPNYTGGSMTWPAASGIAVYAGANAWGTSLTAPTGALVGVGQANTYTAGEKQTFTSSSTTAGEGFAGVTADPSSLSAGDRWFRTDSKRVRVYDGSAAQSVAWLSDLSGYLTANQSITLSGDATGSGSTAITVSVPKVNGTSVPANSAADQVLGTTASATGSWLSVPSCLDSAGQHLNYNTSTHSFVCGTTGGTAGSAAFNTLTGGTNTQAAMVVGSGASLAPSGSGTVTANALSGVASSALSDGSSLVKNGTDINSSNQVTSTHLAAALPVAQGGTGQTSASAGFNALSPMTTLGDLTYESAANTASRLAGNTTATKNFLCETGTGSVSAAPVWCTIAGSDVPTLNQSTTGNAATATTSTNLASGVLGSVPYQSASASTSLLAPNTTTTKQYLTQTGTGSAGAAPVWNTIAASDVPTLNQSTTGNAATATTSTNVAGGAVGSIPYQSAASTTALLSGNTAATDQVLVSHGTGSAAQAPTLSNSPALSATNMTSFPESAIATAIQSATGCSTAGYVFSPQSNSCVASGGSMVYPGAGIAVSTGSAWGSSLTAPASALVGISDTQTLTNKSIAGSEVNSGSVAIAYGGTGQTTAAAAFNALSPITTLGDLLYGSAANTSSRLAGNTTSTKQFLTQTGTGSVSAAPAWGTISSSDVAGIGNYALLASSPNFTGGTITATASSASAGLDLFDSGAGGHNIGLLEEASGYTAFYDATSNTTPLAWLSAGMIQTTSAGGWCWSSNSGFADQAAYDTCLTRNAAGAVQVTNGTGGLGTLIASTFSGNATTATTATNVGGGAVGSLPYQSGASTTALLAGNTAATDQVVVSHGTGSVAQAPTLSNAPALSAANMTSFSESALNTALQSATGCTTAGYVFSPQSNTCVANGGGSMVYPGAGIAVSTGSAWGTSLTAPSSTIVGISDTQTLTNKSIAGSEVNSGSVAIANGGTGQTTASAAFNALSPMTTLGDLEYESGTSTSARLAGNTTSTKKFLTQTGTGSVSAAPGWNTIAAADVPGLSGGAVGSLPYQSAASTTSFLSPNTSTTMQYLTQTGTGSAGAAPVWTNAPAAKPPYLTMNGTTYIPTDAMGTATLPSLSSWSVITGSQALTSSAAQTGGDWWFNNTSTTTAFVAAPSGTTSITAAMTYLPTATNGSIGVWFYDSTNGKLQVLQYVVSTSGGLTYCVNVETYNGSTIAFSSNTSCYGAPGQPDFHIKGSVSGTTLTFSTSSNGGASYVSLPTITVGTISKMGIAIQGGVADVFSVVTQ